MTVNACVTGIVPGFRYVLLSDALIDSLPPLETAAVFGHEIGHIASRIICCTSHFTSLVFLPAGLLSLFGELIARADPMVEQLASATPWGAESAGGVV